MSELDLELFWLLVTVLISNVKYITHAAACDIVFDQSLLGQC